MKNTWPPLPVLFLSIHQRLVDTKYQDCLDLGKGLPGASQVALVVKKKKKNHLPMQVDIRDVDLIPGSERSPGEGHGNPLQYSCLENPMDRGAWWATVHGVAQSQTRLSTHAGGFQDEQQGQEDRKPAGPD